VRFANCVQKLARTEAVVRPSSPVDRDAPRSTLMQAGDNTSATMATETNPRSLPIMFHNALHKADYRRPADRSGAIFRVAEHEAGHLAAPETAAPPAATKSR
jgi:hypothetical protein